MINDLILVQSAVLSRQSTVIKSQLTVD